jgi:hypothetical protein
MKTTKKLVKLGLSPTSTENPFVTGDVVGGLAVTPSLELATKGAFHVTHIASGLKVIPEPMTQRIARKAMAEVLQWGVDWNLSKAEILRNKPLSRHCQNKRIDLIAALPKWRGPKEVRS